MPNSRERAILYSMRFARMSISGNRYVPIQQEQYKTDVFPF